VQLVRVSNFVTKAISKLGGGYDYSVSYLVDGSVLVDSGFPWARRSLRRALLDLGVSKSLTTVVNTHAHEDHTGNNDLMAAVTEANVYAHPLAIAKIRHPVELPWYRNFMFGPVTAADVLPVPAEIKTRRFTLQVHHMPGHSPDHICLFEPERRWLFSGDLYISADLDTQLQEVDGPTWIESLERAMALRPLWLFDAHGLVVNGDAEVRALLTRKRDFLKGLGERIGEASTRARSVKEITREVFVPGGLADALSFRDGWLSLLTCSDFSRAHLVESFLRERVGGQPID
jgi:glyoxylase-like metal-dependent hydrolase (beta-lactamase superfamily II)